jgi:hypothetical protein
MTDQDHIPRFSDGTPVHPIERPKRGTLMSLVSITLGWLALLAVIAVTLYVALALLASATARGDEPHAVFEQPGECLIDMDLHVMGTRRAACVERLSTALRLAKGEMLVNERSRRARR